jgi:hypothetical protein
MSHCRRTIKLNQVTKLVVALTAVHHVTFAGAPRLCHSHYRSADIMTLRQQARRGEPSYTLRGLQLYPRWV